MSKYDYYPHPCPGQAFVGMKPQYGDYVGDIVIPRNAPSRVAIGRVGQVVAINPFPENELSWVYVDGVSTAMPAWKLNWLYVQLLEQFVVCKNATLLWGELYRVRLEHIESLVPEEAIPSPDELGRCKRCRSTSGEGNILLGPDGYCPNCGFNRYDQHKSEECINLSESDIDYFVRKPMEMDHFMRTGGKALHNRLYSFGGKMGKVQDNRMPVALDSELSELMKMRRR